jgi:hypothetical protein
MEGGGRRGEGMLRRMFALFGRAPVPAQRSEQRFFIRLVQASRAHNGMVVLPAERGCRASGRASLICWQTDAC